MWTDNEHAIKLPVKVVGDSPSDVGEVSVTNAKRRRKDWRMSCDVSEATEGATERLANETLLIVKPFRCRFTYVTGIPPMSPGEPLLVKVMKEVQADGDEHYLVWDCLYLSVARQGSRPGVFNPRPSGEFCSTREGHFTKENALWILKLELLDTIWLKENKFTARSKILNYPKP